jgi:hypothetical protein
MAVTNTILFASRAQVKVGVRQVSLEFINGSRGDRFSFVAAV